MFRKARVLHQPGEKPQVSKVASALPVRFTVRAPRAQTSRLSRLPSARIRRGPMLARLHARPAGWH
jgi:hypothetical protein